MIVNIVIVNAVIFIVDALFLEGRLRSLFAVQSGTLLKPWQWWRLLTYGFAHYDFYHVLFNLSLIHI